MASTASQTTTAKDPQARPTRVRTRLLGVLRVFVGRIPPPVGNAIADRIGDVVYHAARKSRRAAISNIRHVLGPGAPRSELTRIVHKIFRNAMRNYFDLIRAPDMTDAQVDRSVDFAEVGWARVLAAHEGGRPVVLVSAHFGSFDMTTQVISRHNLAVTVLVAEVKPAWLSAFFTDLRGSRGLGLITVSEEEAGGVNLGALKESLALLRKGGVLGIVADRNTEQRGTRIEFMGYDTIVASGVAKMALRTRAATFLGICKRLPRNRYSVTFIGPIEPEGSASNDEDVATYLTRVFSGFEPYIRENPEQWVLLQPVWPNS